MVDLRAKLTGKPSILGQVEWFSELLECELARHSDTELLITGIPMDRHIKAGDTIALLGMDFPMDGAYIVELHPDAKIAELGTGVKITCTQPHNLTIPNPCSIGFWKSWSVYDPQALPTGQYLDLQRIQSIEKPAVLGRPEQRQLEAAELMAKGQGLLEVAGEFQNFQSDDSDEVTPEKLHLLKQFANLDLSVLRDIAEQKRTGAIEELDDESAMMHLIGREIEIMCGMSAGLMAQYYGLSLTFQNAVLELYSEIMQVVVAANEKEAPPKGKAATKPRKAST